MAMEKRFFFFKRVNLFCVAFKPDGNPVLSSTAT